MTNVTTAPLQHYAAAYAGLLKQLSTVPQIAELHAYKTAIIGRTEEQITNRIYQELSMPNGAKLYEDEILAITDDLTSKALGKVSNELWEETAQQVDVANVALASLTDEQKLAWLELQGIGVCSENLSNLLAAKVTEYLTNPRAMIESLQPYVLANMQEQEAAQEEAIQEEIEKAEHGLQDSVVKFVSTLLTAACGKETIISREDAARLIAENPRVFGHDEEGNRLINGHSHEHYKHVLMESADNFQNHAPEKQQEFLLAGMRNFVEANKQTMTVAQLQQANEQIERGLGCLTADDVVRMMDTLRVIPSPGFVAGLEQRTQHEAKEVSFTDFVNNRKAHCSAAMNRA